MAKINEESEELILAARSSDRAGLVHETADLWFHCMVLLAHFDLGPGDVAAELERRFGRSGHEEKRLRSNAESS